ncbi:MAG: ABC transporter ATP-binding protein [Anaerolineae bacterium]|nr:ABC transporter ATP-binding protein [Anaerolineae bacterium]
MQLEHTNGDAQQSMSAFAAWRRMMGYLSPYKLWVTIAIFGIVGGAVLAVLIPRELRDVIDIGITKDEPDFMITAGVLVIGLGVLRGISGFLARYFGERLSHFASYDIRNQLYNHVQLLPFNYHNNAQTGTLVTIAIADVDEMQRYFAYGLIDGLNTLLLFGGSVTIMALTSLPLTLIVLIPVVPLAYLSVKFATAVDPGWRRVMERVQKLGNQLQETVIGAQVVRAFARERYEIGKFNRENEMLFVEQLGLVRQWARFLPASAFIVAICVASVLFFGGLMAKAGVGGVTVGTVVAFNAYVALMGQPIRFVGFVIILTTQAIASSRRVFEVLDAPITIDSKTNARSADDIQGLVTFEDVSFRYDDSGDLTLDHIQLQARPGDVVALLGQTGSGKSTVINLIPRFHDVSEGRVTIDGVDVRDYDLLSLRRQIGVVLQESLLFSATIHDNICYGRPEATREQVIAAAKAANAHDFILEFENGYDTEIGERGVTLSGGQRQRVAIARALLINPRILILDDSTSSVDTQTEFLIQEALNRLMQGRTTFIIAQRLTTVQTATQILVLDHGRIAERGTHQELLDKNGLYAEIYRLQLQDQERLKHEMMALGGLVEDAPNRHS